MWILSCIRSYFVIILRKDNFILYLFLLIVNYYFTTSNLFPSKPHIISYIFVYPNCGMEETK